MKPLTVWLNKSFSSTYNVVESLRAGHRNHAAPGETLRVLCTHTHEDCTAFRVADTSEVEPKNLKDADYLAYCLDVIRRHAVDVFIPGKNLGPLVRERRRLEETGVRLLVAAAGDMLKMLENKAHLYRSLTDTAIALPDYRAVNTLAEFDEAYAQLKSRRDVVCFKPCVSVFGLGFRIVTEKGNSLDRLLGGNALKLSLEETRHSLSRKPHFRDLMVMQYLPGPERSVDCLARDGVLIRCVVRRKSPAEGGQLLESNPELVARTAQLTERLKLTGLFNVQYRDADGVSYLLEINPRMSGGLHYACLSGVEFPYWGVRLLMNTVAPDAIPQPQTGFRVGQVNRAIRL